MKKDFRLDFVGKNDVRHRPAALVTESSSRGLNQNPNRALKPRSLFTLFLIFVFLLPSVSVPPNARAATLKSLAFSSSKSELGEGQSVTLLADGRQLLIGGQDSPAGVFIRDPRTSELTPVPGGLHFPRAWHTATVLADGNVLILGGVGPNGQILENAEIFDPESKTVQLLSDSEGPYSAFRIPHSAFDKIRIPHSAIEARAFHTATLLTDGRVLIAGGVSKDGKILDDAEVWDPQSGAIEKPSSGLAVAHYGHTATLLSDGNVILSGGFDRDSAQLKGYELFDAEGQSFTALDTFSEKAENAQPHLAASLPENDEDNVKADSVIALRFSNALRVETVNSQTVILGGASGIVATKVVAAEGGMLAFVTPVSSLLAGSDYSLTISGPVDRSDSPLPLTAIRFRTENHPVRNLPREGQPSKLLSPLPQLVQPLQNLPAATTPTQSSTVQPHANLNSLSETAPSNTYPTAQADSLLPLQAEPGVTALAGRVLNLQDQPIENITICVEGLDEKMATTDSTGRFLLKGIDPGHQKIMIDGHPASTLGKVYGIFKVGVDIAKGQTNVLPYTIWLPRIDKAHAVTIPSPTKSEVVITTPLIPGLEVHIPPNAVIYDYEGKAVTELSITEIPVDKPPFPLARNVQVPVYFTIQPGGAYVKSSSGIGARIVYPNLRKDYPGTRYTFFHYDPGDRGWYAYAGGQVTADGKQVMPDAGKSVYEFTGAMFWQGQTPASGAPAGGGRSSHGDPVDLGSGLFVYNRTDLYLPDILPLELTRTYRSEDTAVRPFGLGTTYPFSTFLWSANQYQEVDLVQPDSSRIHYVRISPGAGPSDAVFEHTATPTIYYKSRIKWNGAGWDLTLKNGTVYVFGENAPLQSIRDRYGNTITITRTTINSQNNNQSGNITRITSPNGKYLDFTYDANSRITQVKDNIGRTVGYT